LLTEVQDGSVQQWQGDPDSKNINDITFTLELLAHLSSQYCIDTSRIYASGKSNGGAFTGLLACDPVASTRIAAFAAVSPAVYLDNSTSQLPACTPGRTGIPFMELHGQQDKTAAYAGGLNTRSNGYTTDVVKYVNGWAERDGFKVDAKTTSTLCGKGKKEVTKFVWGDERVVHYRYKNVGHDWMSATENLDTAGLGGDARTCKEAEASRVVLEWFGRWKV
jgi:poly(3-hydroxybutyrate) depolymerase